MARWNRSKETVERHQKLRRRIFWVVGLGVSLYLLVPLIIGDMGLVKYFKMRKTYHHMQQEIRRLSDENRKIEEEVRALRSDPVKIEQLARNRLGWVRPGETVYQFKPAAPTAQAPPNSKETDRP